MEQQMYYVAGAVTGSVLVLSLVFSKRTSGSSPEKGFGQINSAMKVFNTLILGLFLYQVVKTFSTDDTTTRKFSLIVCCVLMIYLMAVAGVAFLYRSLESLNAEEAESLMIATGNAILSNKLEHSITTVETSSPLGNGTWTRKNGHYFRSEGVIDLSRKALAHRLSRPDYNFVTRHKLSTLELSREAMFTDMLQLCARDQLGVVSGGKDWTLAHHDPDGDITVEVVLVEGTKWNCYRVSGMIEATPMEVASLVIDDNRIGEYDFMFDKIEFLEKVDARSSIRHSKYKAIWPTMARDFVINTTWEPLDDGRVLVATRSVDHPLVPAKVEGYVRARVLCAGYLMTPVRGPGGNLTTFCDVIIHTDVNCDWLPPAFINPFSNTKPAGYFRNMQRICAEEFPPTPLVVED